MVDLVESKHFTSMLKESSVGGAILHKRKLPQLAKLILDVVDDSKPYSLLTHIRNISEYLLAVSLLQLVLMCLGVTVAVLDTARSIITVITRPQSDSMNHTVTNEPMISTRV